MTFPSRVLCLLLAIPAVMSFAMYLASGFWPALLAVDGVVAAVAIFDLLTLPRTRRLQARRECGTVASQGERHAVALVIENRSQRPLLARVRDDVDQSMRAEPDWFRVRVPSRSRAQVSYILVPSRRGSFELQCVFVESASRWRLWRRMHKLPAATRLRVYPALKQINRYALYARLNKLSLLGVRESRKIGTDNEFERLREYNFDDQFKAIDWRSTARRRKLMVKDFQSNHSQRMVFLVDAGRMMVNDVKGFSLLDHVLDSILMLAHVALARGDQVGLLCFSDRVLRWLSPGGGRRQLNRMVHLVHDLHPTLVESRYDQAFLHLHRNCRKRTLAVLITNVIDELNAAQIHAQLTNLAGKHLPLAVFLRDHEVFDLAHSAPPAAACRDPSHLPVSAQTLYRAAAAADLLEWRHQVLLDLRHQGALTLDVFPESLTAPLINEYLRIKSRHLL